MAKQFLAITIIIVMVACNSNSSDDNNIDSTLIPKWQGQAPPEAVSYNITAEYPHDTSAYTQGLEVHNGKLYEGTGDFETSSLRIVDIKTGKIEKKYLMGSKEVFGEGITILKGKLYQLTWKNNAVYVYDVNNIGKPTDTLKWPYDGWGITNNSTDLIISDGSSNIYFVNANDLKVKNILSVTTHEGPLGNLNELEYIEGFIYANVYLQDYIVKIDPSSGQVVGKIDLTGFAHKYFPDQITPGRTDVLNGIAYDSAKKSIYITGKRWPKLFELKLN